MAANDDLGSLELKLGHRFNNRSLLKRALTHASLDSNRSGKTQSNERMEFLGDRVLGLTIARLVFDSFPNDPEGSLARRHTALVRKEALARVGQEIGLGDYIIMTSAEEAAGGRENPTLIADCCEAVIAALYLDASLETAENFILAHWAKLKDEDTKPPKDNKTTLQEWAQAKGLPLPNYVEIGREGPAHAPMFVIEVSVNGLKPVRASGTNKKTAAQNAAGLLLETISDEPQ